MFVKTCNRCGRPTQYSAFNFEIEEDTISESKWDHFDGPDVRLDDFHLCTVCMKDFVTFIKDGKKL